MEPKFQTSFIPKKPIVSNQGKEFSPIRTTSILSIVSTVVFLVTLISSGATYFYKNLLTSQLDTAKKSLDDAHTAFQPDKIKELINANSRIISTKNLLEKHITISKLLLLIQTLTVKKMRFTSLTYSKKTEDGKGPTLTMDGEAQTYNALAQQSIIFGQSQFLKNQEFSNFSLDDKGNVKVNFFATVDPIILSYKKAIETASPQ